MTLTTEQQALVKRLEQSRNNGTGLMLQDPASVGILHQLIVDLLSDKKEIPEGATHYCDQPYVGYFYFYDQWFEWNELEDCWNPLHFNPNKYRELKPLY